LKEIKIIKYCKVMILSTAAIPFVLGNFQHTVQHIRFHYQFICLSFTWVCLTI